MAHYAYIVLTTSDSGSTGRFGVVFEGRKPVIRKRTNIDPTVEGGQEITMGGIHETHTYTIRVRETETRPSYGNLALLKYLFMLNNPNGTPSNVLTMVDHFGVSYSVMLIGDFSETLLGVSIEGPEAWSIAQLDILFL